MTEHKPELHQRVMHRRSELEATLAHLSKDENTAKSLRAQAVTNALAVLDNNLSAGWEHVGAVESAQLARWLETTPILVDASVDQAQSEALYAHHEGRWHLEAAGFPMQNFELEPAPPNAKTRPMSTMPEAASPADHT